MILGELLKIIAQHQLNYYHTLEDFLWAVLKCLSSDASTCFIQNEGNIL